MTRPSQYAAALSSAFADAARGIAPAKLGDYEVFIERPRDPGHGDFSCNLAMRLARDLKRKPREVAGELLGALESPPFVDSVDVAGPGFINVTLAPSARGAVLDEILERRDDYGRGDPISGKVLVEFVSANPTGPVHIGHGRQAAHGSSLARILRFRGWERVDCEYYVNDSGRQIDVLGLTLWLRYLQQGGQSGISLPSEAYAGDYMIDLARRLREQHGDRFDRPPARERGNGGEDPESADSWVRRARSALGEDFDVVVAFAKDAMLDEIREDLAEFGADFDQWASERAIWESGCVDEALERAGKAELLYEKDGAQWFRSTSYGDEKDRVVRRSNGEPTYFASDFGYHLDKYKRGYDRLILEVGQDHHGYQPRMKALVAGLGYDPDTLEMKMFAMVRLFKGKQAQKLTTRGGQFVSLRDLVGWVGRDAARFIFLTRRSNQALDFDADLAVRSSADNPVYYVQYAHARICSVLRQWGGKDDLLKVDGSPLDHEDEIELLRQLLGFGDAVDLAAREREPHVIAFYLRELAAAFHGYYNEVPFLDAPEPQRLARLKLAEATRVVLANALGLLGVSAPERMER